MEKEPTPMPIKIPILDGGNSAGKMEKELTFITIQEWDLLVNGKRIKSLKEDGYFLMEHTSKDNSRIINQTRRESGILKTATSSRETIYKQ